MKTTIQGWVSSFSGLLVAVVTLLGITGVAFASGGAIFNPGSLSNQVGAPLGGIASHSDIQQCSACHTSPWETATMADRCLACHSDITAQLQDPASLHSVVRFGQTDLNCRTCHTEHHGPAATLTRIPPGWDPHDQLGFSLKTHRLRMDGTPFECRDCHVNGYSGPFDQMTCATCHLKVNQVFTQDHILTFWTNCQACHDGLDSHGSNFDHNQVPFKLVGIHALTLCSQCHIGAHDLPSLQATKQDCFACHEKDDQHLGQFGTQCGVCHTAEGWGKSAQFDHNLASFKLTGLHVKVICTDCHINNKYKGIPSDCFSCHAKDDKHAGQFGTDCASCHTSDGWNRAVDHSKFAFKLDGKHTTVACESCHKNADFKNTSTNCFACHAKDDTHAGQFGTQCETCHTPADWTSATFDHNTVSFKLAAHKTKTDGTAFVCKDCHVKSYASPFDQVVCANCHLNVNKAFASDHILTFWTNCMACHDGLDSHGKAFDHNKVSFHLIGKHSLAKCSTCHINDRTIADMQATSQDCFSCHQKDDFHNGQFGTSCGSCHSPEAWKPAKVDHSKFAFHLDGKHSSVVCASCHINGVFKGTPMDCASCHTKDDAHAGSLGTQCGTCHTPDGWKPAKVDHSKFAFHLDGKHSTAACTSCHINGVFKGTPMDCASCHTKDDAHAGSLGTQCGTCHTPLGWSPATFDHNSVSFKLTAHKIKTDGTAFVCKDCHVKGYAAPFDQNTCGNCHLQINQVFSTEHFLAFGTNCMACHDGVESHGTLFDHNKVAFNLIGKHAPLKCSVCHINARTLKDLKATPLACVSCHQKDDHHNGQFGVNCASCHTPEGWSLAKVDHSKFAFHLDGKHAAVACESCHKNGVFKGTPQDCFSCHEKNDFHKGQLGTQCGACHQPAGWKPATVDHSKFAFHLDGKHSTVICANCHINGVFKGTPTDCASCHIKDDAHGGQLGTLCATCHSPAGWKPATVDHSKFPFHLDGKHSAVACAGCHKNNIFKDTPTDCASCHTKDDAHAGTLGNQCGTCHSPAGWSPATFDHNSVSFKLTSHKTKTDNTAFLCKDCHVKGYAAPFDQNICGNCHLQIDQVFSTEHFLTFGTDCKACHDGVESHGSNFDHAKVAFPLSGKHIAAKCSACHINARTIADLKAAPKDCFSCHEKDDNHKGQLGTQCGACHLPAGWKPATVDHSKFAFHLDGKHSAVACTGCHINGVFKGTPMACASCHTKDDAHAGTLGTQCGTCHSPAGWSPATFDHNSVSFKLTSHKTKTDNTAFLCKDCHVKGYAAPFDQDSCGNCHLQINQVFSTEHFLAFGTNCMACHDGVESRGSNFDHAKVAFPLSGKHIAAKCSACHINARTIADLKAAPKDCFSCHEKDDNHKGQLGTQCGACHLPAGWKPATVDHSKFAFHLDGKHSAVACTNCHINGVFKGTPTDCASCHTKDDAHAGTLGNQCATCHSPAGWKPSTFNHNNAAFHLTGKHSAVVCQSCHINGVFKGTPTDCASCHIKDDAHAGQLGTLCATCHSPAGWKPATVDHSKFAFHLDGKHSAVACTGCHKNNIFKDTPTDCASCHTKDDAHAGTLGSQCGTCHSPAGWSPSTFDHNSVSFKLTSHKTKTDNTAFACKDCHVKGYTSPFDQDTCGNCHLQINLAFATEHFLTFGTDCMACHNGVESLGSAFNHNLVSFKLAGKHAPLACSKCHINVHTLSDLKSAPQACVSCHLKDDHHNGQFGTECAGCHSPDGWALAKVDHSKFAFHLDGKHSVVACESCHINGVFKGTPTACASCHTKDDAHAGTLGTQCAICHSPSGWKPSTFNHSSSAFQLTGKHASVLCASCHINGVFKGTPMDCASCHTKNDPHAGKLGTQCAQCHTTSGWTPSTFDHKNSSFQLTGKHTAVTCAQCHKDKFFVGTPATCVSCHGSSDPHAGALGAQCETCHTTAGWKPTTFNHANSIFKLTGAHTTVLCASCHADLKFKGTPTTCYACHAANDHHGGKYGTNCAACHSTTAWKPATFNHNLSAFPLTGAHINVVCANCHINSVFVGTPKDCYSCHKTKDVHVGKAGTNCATCHTTTAWKPSTFKHTFPLTHGLNPIVACVTCHPSTTSAYTCFSCHEHTISNMASKHIDVRNYSSTTCADCHATGRTP